MPLIRVRVHEGLIHILQIILDLIVGGADNCLKSKPPDQGDTACHLLRIHLGECFIQYDQAYGRIAPKLQFQITVWL